MALLIFSAILIAVVAGHWSDLGGTRKQQYWLFMVHKSLGLTALALAVVRLGWQLSKPRPPALPTHSQWEKKAAKAVHLLLYALLFALPLSGWWLNSVAGVPLKYFLLFPVPAITAASPAWENTATWVHNALGLLLIGILVAHLGGALKHHWLDKDATLNRMLINGLAGKVIASLSIALATAALLSVALSKVTASSEPLVEDVTVASDPGTAGSWQVLDSSRLSFSVDVLGTAANGVFEQFSARIDFDPDNLSGSSLSATVATASIFTDNSTRDEMLPEADWFAVEDHARALFETTAIRRVADGTYVADATLRIKDATREFDFPFTWQQTNNTATLKSTVTLNRLDYGLGANEFSDEDTIAYDVKVSVELQLRLNKTSG